jgi:hypothetical protein
MPGERVCPSSTLDNATNLLGAIGADGRVHFVSPALRIDDDFRSKARASGRPEQRFRFAGPCVEGRCERWTGTRCGVIDELLPQLDDASDELDRKLRPCAIRRTCRWFAQVGGDACKVCPWVITDSRVLDETA